MPNITDITITSLETITAFEIGAGGAYLFTLDELQNASIANTLDKQDITGKGGRKLSSLKRNKAATVSGANGMVSGGLLEMQTGSSFENGATEVMWTDYITVDTANGTFTTYKADGTPGAEIIGLYVKNANGTLGAKLEQGDSADATHFVYNPSTRALTLDQSITSGTELVAYYERKISASVLVNKSDVFSGKCALYVDAMAEDKCAKVYRVQFYFPKADFNGEFTIDLGDNQTVHNFEAEALSGACGTAGQLWTYTIFEDDAQDADSGDLTGIEITTPPTKTAYTAGEKFDTTGMVVKASYASGGAAVTLAPGAYTFAPNVALTVNDSIITISYTESGVTKTATQAITVSAS